MPYEAQGKISIPDGPRLITAEWLTTALRHSGALENASVLAVRSTEMEAGRGFLGQVARLRIEYDCEQAGAPVSLFVKQSPGDPLLREALKAAAPCHSEVGFYRDLARGQPLQVPLCYLSLSDEESGASILLLEDLSSAELGDDLKGCSPAQARQVTQQMAILHAHFWDSPALEGLPWLRAPMDDLGPRPLLYELALPVFESRYEGWLEGRALESVRRFAELMPDYFQRYSQSPRTLIHGDLRADNLAFQSSLQGSGLVVFDWAGSRRALGVCDLAFFLACGLPVAQRRLLEMDLLELYCRTLADHGVQAYSLAQLERDFCLGLGFPLATLVIGGGLLDFSSNRGQLLMHSACERIGAALADHPIEAFS
jgi:hypothetical protein